jgi:hypothetical protein
LVLVSVAGPPLLHTTCITYPSHLGFSSFAYLHKGSDDTEVVITGQATPEMAGMNVLWVV